MSPSQTRWYSNKMSKLHLYIQSSYTVISFTVIIHLTIHYCFIQSSVCVLLLQFKNLNFHAGFIYAFSPHKDRVPSHIKQKKETYWQFSPGKLLCIPPGGLHIYQINPAMEPVSSTAPTSIQPLWMSGFLCWEGLWSLYTQQQQNVVIK